MGARYDHGVRRLLALLLLAGCSAPAVEETPRDAAGIRARLSAVRMDVAWADTPVPVAIDELWKRTGLEIQVDG
jgi:hypothetical protein